MGRGREEVGRRRARPVVERGAGRIFFGFFSVLSLFSYSVFFLRNNVPPVSLFLCSNFVDFFQNSKRKREREKKRRERGEGTMIKERKRNKTLSRLYRPRSRFLFFFLSFFLLLLSF